MAKIIALGELLIDFTPAGKSENGKNLYECNPGGGVPNVLSCLSSLGNETELIASVGGDAFGEILIRSLIDAGIGVSCVKMKKNVPTTLAIVSLDDRGDRSFSFYRKGCADLKIGVRQFSKSLFVNADALHIGSLSTVMNPSRDATYQAIEYAREAGCLISFDPNWRPFLWQSAREALAQMRALSRLANIMKVSEEELELLTDETGIPEGAEKLLTQSAAEILFVTVGGAGSHWFTRAGERGHVPPARTDGVIDTTGAGDYFIGGALDSLLKTKKPLSALTKDDLANACRAGNACGWQVARVRGALGTRVSLPE